MAIALEVNTEGDPIAGTVDAGSASGRTIIFESMTASGSDSITAVSLGGESFTKLGSVQAGTARYHSMWYLIPSNGNVGMQTLTITGSSCCNTNVMVYSGTDRAAPKNFNSVSGNTSGAVSLSITANDGDWIVGGGQSNVGNISMGSNTTSRNAVPSSNGNFDSNGAASPTALNITLASAGAYCILGAAIAPVAVPYGPNYPANTSRYFIRSGSNFSN